MEDTQPTPPLPQSVGREFVRQYYTLLNRAPNHLHRFYNSQSSFTHDESTLVVGQKNIHSRIQQLNFQNCRAKISQVEAQATLGNGVVILVTGELSNDGQPMRRFTQTFVLAAQSPKKYYVHNDIFRYQDVYSEEENDLDVSIKSEGDLNNTENQQEKGAPGILEVNKEKQVIQVAIEQQHIPIQMGDVGVGTANIITQQHSQAVYYSVSADGAMPITVLSVPTTAGPVSLRTNFTNLTSNGSSQQDQIVQANGVATHDEHTKHGIAQRTSILTQSSLNNPSQSSIISQDITAPAMSNEMGCAQKSVEKISNHPSQVFSQTNTVTIENYQQQQQGQPKPPSAVQTYANLFKSSSNCFVNRSIHQQLSQNHSNKNLFQATSTISSTTFTQSSNSSSLASLTIYGARYNTHNNTTNNSNNHANENSTQCLGNNQCYQAPLPQRPGSKSFNRDFDQRRTSNYQFGDNQQLFLGNIPHHAAEDDLKTLFSRFGTVLDLKILSKAPGKLTPGIRNPLNYGFITYKDVESVQNCLAHCPLYFPENSSSRQKLNVEKKKPRNRANNVPIQQSASGCGNTDGSGVRYKIYSNQRNLNNNQPAPLRSLSNSGGGNGSGNNMTRGSGANNNRYRGGSSGPRMGNTFNRNDNRNSNNRSSGGGGASQMRDSNNNTQTAHNN